MLGIAGLAFIIIAPIFIYRNAKQNGHNALLWTLLALAVGFGLQLIIPIIIVMILGVVWASQGHPVQEIQQMAQVPGTIISIIGLVLSVVGVLMVFRQVNIVKDLTESQPPTPPNFNQ